MVDKHISAQEQWHEVQGELEGENIKLAYYDDTLISHLDDVAGKKILDYGAGPGVLALALKKLGADVYTYDINPDMNAGAAEKIGADWVYDTVDTIPTETFDIVICNLVVCIVPEADVARILENIRACLSDTGHAYIGFCNPKIYNVEESQIDYRCPTGCAYHENHDYKKIKKEGGYELIESHRPIEWYEKQYAAAGLELVETIFTPKYEYGGVEIEDFAIFTLRRA